MILAIETATDVCGVALVHRGMCIAQRVVGGKNIHSERLMVLVDEVLREACVEMSALDAVAVSIGPGSFTGLRIGLSAAKGLAYARSLPLVPVPTLDALAYEALRMEAWNSDTCILSSNEAQCGCAETTIDLSSARCGKGATIVCAAIDAKRDEAYYAFYEVRTVALSGGVDDVGDVLCLDAHAIAPVREIAAKFPHGAHVLMAGDGAAKVAVARHDTHVNAGHSAIVCSPVALGLLAERRFAQLVVKDYSELEPVYIRDFVATVPRIATHTPIP